MPVREGMSRRGRSAREGRTRGIAVLLTGVALSGCVFIAPAAAQQTLFNVPSADVLPAGKLYLEEDDLWRPGRGEDTFFALRAVAGLG